VYDWTNNLGHCSSDGKSIAVHDWANNYEDIESEYDIANDSIVDNEEIQRSG
jgi:hypothetical protein